MKELISERIEFIKNELENLVPKIQESEMFGNEKEVKSLLRINNGLIEKRKKLTLELEGWNG